ncbi:Calcium uniporter protein, mitochondrial [Thelohanellus kitauei]|uniref:Calcium uniporter protein n=1 Tax=Thelohanellus kitauei TaxID=669202 RepID=A0A0C2MUE4_THEKT|nr:Calcium uniporter protein, mitochondrial [Thelohanellus kitauei]
MLEASKSYKATSVLVNEHDQIIQELVVMEDQVEKLKKDATRRTELILNIILLYMGFQTGFLSYLTFIEYSWDVMEPITYFITYSANIYGFMYYMMHKKEYNNENLNEYHFLNSLQKYTNNSDLDLKKYIQLKNRLEYLKNICPNLKN